MYVGFFHALREIGVPVTLREYLTLLEALEAGAADYDVVHFYHLARATLVKDERYLDRFDRAFARWFEGLEDVGDPWQQIPEEWLAALGERYLTDEQRAKLQSRGFDELMEMLRKRLAEQDGRHQGGSKWIGTGGTSPFGAYGDAPEGVRIGQDRSRRRRAVKVWDRREFRDLDDRVELGTRALKLALRKLRRLAREGVPDEIDLDETIRGTARNAGYLDLHMRASRRDGTKVLLLLDAGGSMDDHVTLVERLFSAARSEFRHLEAFYFHNCPYERVWRNNRRRRSETIPTDELWRTFGPDYRLVLVGDATMSPYELTEIGGSVEHWNEESGVAWMRRLTDAYERALWINPVPEDHWEWTPSIGIVQRLMRGRMVPLTLEGIERGSRELKA